MSPAGATANTLTTTDALDLAAETLYRFLAMALADPRTHASSLLLDGAAGRLTLQAADLLRDEFQGQSLVLGIGEAPVENLDLSPALAALPDSCEALADEFIRVFGLVYCRDCPPYETEFHANEDTFFRSQQMADVAGFYRAFGMTAGGLSRERPDYLPMELEFAAFLLLKQRLAADEPQAEACRDARASFVRDHLSWWAPSFAQVLRRKAMYGFHAEAALVLSSFLPVERARLGIAAPSLPIEARPAESGNECEGCLLKQ